MEGSHSPVAMVLGLASGKSDFARGVVIGAAASLILIVTIALLLLRSTDMYGLDHWKLNIRTPLPSMWMNLGFW